MLIQPGFRFVSALCRLFLWCYVVLLASLATLAQSGQPAMSFDVTMPQPDSHLFHVSLQYSAPARPTVDFKLPVWTPGYYQLMNYAQYVQDFRVTNDAGKPLQWQKTGNNTWRVQTAGARQLNVAYDVKATHNFVAGNYLDTNRAYISPAGLFLHVAGQLQQPVTLTVHPYKEWPSLVATGLDSVRGQPHTFTAPDFDILYDSPLLLGKLEKLPSFTVRGIPHYFVGYKLGDFDRQQFVTDLQKIVAAGADIIGDIPYKQYTFLAIGPGGGGIEHLNSTSISFDGSALNSPAGKLRLYKFLAHEYFHHYNVKRIRPVALGPFDYDRENRTRMLWVSEGFTVYYEYLMLRRAGLMTEADLLTAMAKHMATYENKPGRLFQSATQASFDTWSDGPFGRTGDEAYKTISYYEKGPVLGMLLDFSIRHATGNRQSLDDVMRTLYQTYYLTEKRGFTDEEFRSVCEKTAGKPLPDVFDYASTVRPIDYPTYLAYAGLAIDTTRRVVSDTWLGLNLRPKADSLLITEVDWESPAWEAGLRSGNVLLRINGERATPSAYRSITPNQPVTLQVFRAGKTEEKTLVPRKKWERSFQLSRLPTPDPLQQTIFNTWANPH